MATHTTSLPATSAEIIHLIGEVDALVIDNILDTRASFAEVAEALASIEDEEAYGDLRHLPSSPRVAEVRAILEDVVLDEPPEPEPVVRV
jgi:hypoxanthine phosphoribosyltransferase